MLMRLLQGWSHDEIRGGTGWLAKGGVAPFVTRGRVDYYLH